MGISLGLVGLGAFGSAFAPLFHAHPQVDRVVLCDREPDRIERFARAFAGSGKFHPRDVHPTLDALLASDVDAVVVITQHWLHAPQCVQAMEAGKHVYSAVPVITVPDGDEILEWCDRLVETSRRTGMHYMLGETSYYHAAAMHCRRMAREGRFGKIVYSEGEYLHSFDSPGCDLRDVYRHRLASAAGQEWAALEREYHRRGGAESPMYYPTHSFSGPLSVAQAPAVSVSALGTAPRADDDPYFADRNTPFANVTALLQLADGSSLRICEHRECSILRETFRIYGTDASYENGVWWEKEKPTALTDEAMRDPLPPEVLDAFAAASGGDGPYGGHGGSHAYLAHEFVDAIATGRRPAIHAWAAARFTAPGVIAQRSALRGGERLAVPDWGDPPA